MSLLLSVETKLVTVGFVPVPTSRLTVAVGVSVDSPNRGS